MSDYIYDENGKQLAWIENGDIFVAAEGKRKIATVRNGQLYSLQGEPLDLFLKGTGVIGLDGNAETPLEFKKLCGIG
ncbi:hypothetical protein AB7M17_004208 [Bradyrhizobium sp. USDA 377]